MDWCVVGESKLTKVLLGPRRGLGQYSINTRYFQHFSEPFLGMVENCLGREYDQETQIVYKSIANFLIQTLIDGYNGEEGEGLAQ